MVVPMLVIVVGLHLLVPAKQLDSQTFSKWCLHSVFRRTRGDTSCVIELHRSCLGRPSDTAVFLMLLIAWLISKFAFVVLSLCMHLLCVNFELEFVSACNSVARTQAQTLAIRTQLMLRATYVHDDLCQVNI
jgi:hypothetical protein